jgi:hypothetical protein
VGKNQRGKQQFSEVDPGVAPVVSVPFFLMGQRWDKNFSCIKIKKCATILLIPVPAGSLFLESLLG